VTAPVTIRPRRIRRVCWVLAPAVALFFAVLGAALQGQIGQNGGVFQRSDQLAMAGIGVLAGVGILLFARPRVVADAHGLRVRNVVGGYDLPWEVVRAIRFERGSPWATLELADDDVVAVMAVQATDKEHAVAGIGALRALHDAHRAASSG
jgi:hypothetical protein